MKELITERYGSIDKMIEETGTTISRPYLYQIVNGEFTNISIGVARELCELLDVSLDKLVELLNDAKKI